MAVDLQYVDSSGNVHDLFQNGEGFWVSLEVVQPSQFQTSFNPISTVDSSLTFEQTTNGGWFQIDDVFLATSIVGDTYLVDSQEYNDDLSENPQLYGEVSVFPNSLVETFIPINEYMTKTSIDSALGKIQENYEFLLNKAKYLTVPPTHISFRYGPSNYSEYTGLGNVWQQLDNGLSTYWDYDSSLSAENIAGTSNSMIYSTGSELIAIPTISGLNPVEYNRDYYIYGDDTFDNILSLEVDSNEYVWMLDKRTTGLGKIGIFNFENTIWKYVASWGSSVSGNLKYFENPTDMKIKGDRIYVACNKAGVGVECRVFNSGGSYIGSASTTALTNIESLAVTNDFIIALLNNELYKFDTTTFQFVEKVSLDERIFSYNYVTQGYEESTITKLANNTTGQFFYGISKNLIYKFGQSGAISESFGETVVNHMNSSLGATPALSYIKPVNDVYHDFDFNLYSASIQDIVTYYERSQTFDRLLDDASFNIMAYVRSLENNTVNKDENATAWIYNRIFDRIIDNLNVYRLALKGSLALISTQTFEKVVINNFTPSQLVELPYQKGDISIGINELHCEGALNRCIRQIYECFETCLGYLNIRDTGEDPESIVIESFTLEGQVAPTPVAELVDGVYYFDYGRPVEQFQFEWEDRIVYRSDPKLRAYMSFDGGTEANISWLPTPNTYEDPRTVSSGTHTWTLRETYGSIEKTADVDVAWNRKIYYGTYPDGANIVGADVLLAQGFVIQPEFDGTIQIDVTDGRRWFIAIPAGEYNVGLTPELRKVVLYHPDYPEMVYNFLVATGSLMSVASFNNGYVNAGTYYVLTASEYGDIYGENIGEIIFRLTREI